MKPILIFIMAILAFHVQVYCQVNTPVDKSKMEIFKDWAGRWKGEGTIQQGPGVLRKSTVEEFMEFKLDGTILCIEGIGKARMASGETKVVHHAYGILSFDQSSNSYKLKSYLVDGKSTDAWFIVKSENTFQWGFEFPTGKVRYNIVLDPTKKTWKETGEYSSDGQKWSNFFEMNLEKSE
jgi:hypothetical protein